MPSLLDNINSPLDIKKLNNSELNTLAKEIRVFLTEKVAQNGGHLAPNLGVVELTLAMHYVFDSPKDKFVWDVGHQSYVHKILTGRKDRFDTLRQYEGLSGFPKIEENEHDAFSTGHSSTSISAALGIARGRDHNKEKYNSIAVIGDGAMTGGMALEALNDAGASKTKLIVILNDNEMSINENVGGLAAYLGRVRTDPKYNRLKDDVEYILKKIPAIGGRVLKSVERIKDALKYLLVSGMLFEELGFTYFGPVNGHNIVSLKEALINVRSVEGPTLVHVVTKKGKGYEFAEKKPDKFHGIGPFDLETSAPIKKNKAQTFTESFAESLVTLAKENNKIIAITAAMSAGTGLDKFAKEFPSRFYDVGIAEQHAVTLAAGLAKTGFLPVVAIYSTFMQRAYDQILHDVCLQKLPVVFAIDRAGIVGEDGPTHHGLFDISFLRNIPNLTIMSPIDCNELRTMLSTALSLNTPVAIRYPRDIGEKVSSSVNSNMPLEYAKGELLKDGNDVLIIAVGSMVKIALEASKKLAKKSIGAAVINARFIKPLDEKLIINQAKKCGKVITVEENVLAGGFGSSILELLEKEKMTAIDVKRIGIPDEFVTHGDRKTLLNKYDMTVEGIYRAVYEVLNYRVKEA